MGGGGGWGLGLGFLGCRVWGFLEIRCTKVDPYNLAGLGRSVTFRIIKL